MPIQAISREDARYPALLREIYDAPERLYCVGNVTLLQGLCVGVVGTRRCSDYGRTQAFQFGQSLSEHGICVVSGLAYGIDAEAHRGALAGGGRTIAVLAQGLDVLRPAGNRRLAREMVKAGGLLVSERPPGYTGFKSDYLVRNRLISGLSKGVLVVEAGHKSGAINTAHHALDQNRDVMAVPGRVSDASSAGVHRLIQKGAQLVSSPKEIAECLGVAWRADTGLLSAEERALLELIDGQPRSSAQLAEGCTKDLGGLYVLLEELQSKGWIRLLADGRWTRARPRYDPP